MKTNEILKHFWAFGLENWNISKMHGLFLQLRNIGIILLKDMNLGNLPSILGQNGVIPW